MSASIALEAPPRGGAKPFTAFSDVTPSTKLEGLNLDWRERDLPEHLRTKHVHRLHPYLGKYIPQLVELFLRKYNPKSVLDPFAGSGTTLVEAQALGISSVGYDVSSFNCLLATVKTAKYNIPKLRAEARQALELTKRKLRPSLFFDDEPFEMPKTSAYLREWFHPKALKELLCFRQQIEEMEYADFFRVVLSRAARSARLTTHFGLDFPKKPTTAPYYCYKHDRECKPTSSAFQFLERYTLDSVDRAEGFGAIRSKAAVRIFHEDSRNAKIPRVEMAMTSPPYVGLIDYHEQHRYAFELLGLEDQRELEIGAATKGNSVKAVEAYRADMIAVAHNVRKALPKGGRLILVAGDKRGLYPTIIEESGFELETVVQRNVNRRTGMRSNEFFESIFVCRK